MKGKWSLSEAGGCKRAIGLFLVLLLLFSIAGRLVSSDCGNVKITRVTFDSRGATISADLYYPSGLIDTDSLPAVLLCHGGGVDKGVMRGMAIELSRRGYVVLSANAYGSGLSELPRSDDGGQGEKEYNAFTSPCGMLDAIEFLRTLKFVDQTRIGMVGHSLGSGRAVTSVLADCGSYTLNDLKINILFDTFHQTFTETEILQNADDLAQTRLNDDQLMYYKQLSEECERRYNTRIFAVCLMGSNVFPLNLALPVNVGGNMVIRNGRVNVGVIDGLYDYDALYNTFGAVEEVEAVDEETMKQAGGYPTLNNLKDGWFTHGDDIMLENWYALDDSTMSSRVLGGLTEISVLDNAALADAIAARSARIFCLNPETHSENFFSVETASDMVRFFEQTMHYNGGELGSSDSHPIEAKNSVFMWNEFFGFLSVLSMIGLIVACAAAFLKTKFFAPCAAESNIEIKALNSKQFWVFGIIGIVISFIAIYAANKVFTPILPNIPLLPFFPSWWLCFILIGIIGIGSAIILIALRLSGKGKDNFRALNVKMPFVNVAKTVLLALLLVVIAYLVMAIMVYLFGQEFRVWMCIFSELKSEYWRYLLRFAILLLPFFLLIGASTNYGFNRDVPSWKDSVITVVMNSLGVWLCWAVSQIITVKTGVVWSSFISTYGMLLLVPITVYITRKMYKLTNSIWLGALMNSLLIGWSFCSSLGLNCNVYRAQDFFNFFMNI